MSESCPLNTGEEVWDGAIPEECLICIRAGRNIRNERIRNVQLRDEDFRNVTSDRVEGFVSKGISREDKTVSERHLVREFGIDARQLGTECGGVLTAVEEHDFDCLQ